MSRGRPDGPRDPIAGPSTPTHPFPLKLRGPVIKGFGRGSKDVRTPSPNSNPKSPSPSLPSLSPNHRLTVPVARHPNCQHPTLRPQHRWTRRIVREERDILRLGDTRPLHRLHTHNAQLSSIGNRRHRDPRALEEPRGCGSGAGVGAAIAAADAIAAAEEGGEGLSYGSVHR